VLITISRYAQTASDQHRSPHTVDEYTGFLDQFAREYLHKFYGPNDETIRSVARQATQEGTQKIKVPQNLMPGLAKLALYDFIILCGTCNIMTSLKRYYFILYK
jgi:hypothetical protein